MTNLVHHLAERSGITGHAGGVDVAEWWRAIWPALARGCSEEELRALAALDDAVWDLAVPRLPGTAQFQVSIYWSGFWLGDTLDAVRQEAAASLAQGYDAVKMRTDPHDVGSSIARFEAIAAELPEPMPIALEFGGTGTPESVRALVGGIDTTRVLWLEDPLPVDQPGATARLASELTVPIGGGESCTTVEQLRSYVDRSRVAVPIIDLGFCGGPSALVELLAVAEESDGPIGVHLDASLTARTLTQIPGQHHVFVEVLDWWEHTSPRELRSVLAGE